MQNKLNATNVQALERLLTQYDTDCVAEDGRHPQLIDEVENCVEFGDNSRGDLAVDIALIILGHLNGVQGRLRIDSSKLYTKAELELECEESYTAGRDDGYDEGHHNGYNEGYNDASK